MESSNESCDPAPALGRGITVLRRLSVDGAHSLEHLARVTGWPKSSLLRILGSLEQAGAVVRDPHSKRWQASLRLLPMSGQETDLRGRCIGAMLDLCRRAGHTVELHAVEGGRPVMIERCEPEDSAVTARARIGYSWPVEDANALTQVLLAHHRKPEDWPRRFKAWQADGQRTLALTAVQRLVEQVRNRGFARDLAANNNHVRRQAIPVFDRRPELVGIIAVAQVCGDDAERVCERIAGMLLDVAPRVRVV